ncbi:short chain dehydrogenase [Ascidiaceihabitans sp.]|uniref:short chain dehydrogenase n=1 Tax=Ascidiaceihabitans sp. TaxID=1872644 RepID=UPI003297D631
MNILVIGAAGDIGQAACAALQANHTLIRAGRSGGDVHVDMSDRASVDAMYARVANTFGTLGAVVCTAGDAHFAPLADQTSDTMVLGLHQKVMGQINLVLGGLEHLADGGSFTLTSGILDRDPIVQGVGAATANGALAGFVKSAAIEMPRRLRINVVSPGMLDVSAARYGAWFAGHTPVASVRVGRAFVKSVEGAQTGQVITVD